VTKGKTVTLRKKTGQINENQYLQKKGYSKKRERHGHQVRNQGGKEKKGEKT